MDYTVTIEVGVTADTPEQAARFALQDLRDMSLGLWFANVQSAQGDKSVMVGPKEI